VQGVRKKGRGRANQVVVSFWFCACCCWHAAAVTREIADSISSHERKFTMVAELSRGLSFEHDIRPT